MYSCPEKKRDKVKRERFIRPITLKKLQAFKLNAKLSAHNIM